MSYKTFTTRFGKTEGDIDNNLLNLKKEFPSCHFLASKRKGISGIVAIRELSPMEYGDQLELENGDVLYLPNASNIVAMRNSLTKFESKWDMRISIKLKTGFTLNIYPASAIPKRVFFGLQKKRNKDNEIYNTDNVYGALAFKLYLKQNNDEKILLSDPEVQELIMLALSNSYDLPIDVIDSLGLVSEQDADDIFIAALGFDPEHIRKQLPLSVSP